MDIATLDFALFTRGTASERDAFCTELCRSLYDSGFARIRNHGFSEERIKELFAWNQKFFALPPELKMKAAHPKTPNPHRGYTRVGQEKLSRISDFEKGELNDRVVKDIKESFDQSSPKDQLYPNIWPDENDIPKFREFLEGFYSDCHDVHLLILQAIAKGLDVDISTFSQYCCENSSELRLNHYPATLCQDILSGSNRISPHTDFGLITLLFQDAVEGLEVEDQNRRGSFIPVKPTKPTDMIINVGDCLQRWTNHRIRSVNHRVVVPPSLKDRPEVMLDDRYSVAYFGKPDRQVSVDTLPAFITCDNPAKYKDGMTSWDYNQAKLLRTY